MDDLSVSVAAEARSGGGGAVASPVYTPVVDPGETLEAPDPVVEAYKRDVDRTLFERNLRLSHTERIEQLQRFVAFLAEVRAAGARESGDRRAH
jgi:hypothetical protein